jgi:hypothetical protein
MAPDLLQIFSSTQGDCGELHTYNSVSVCPSRLVFRKLMITYSTPNIIRMIKSRRMRCGGHVARMGERRNEYRILVGNPE